MVVIVILGVLAALVVPRVLERPDEARVVAAKSDIATIVQALKLYRLDNQRYPTDEQGLAALVAKPEQPPVPPNWKPGGYLERLPKDPWGRAVPVPQSRACKRRDRRLQLRRRRPAGRHGRRRRHRLVGPLSARAPASRALRAARIHAGRNPGRPGRSSAIAGGARHRLALGRRRSRRDAREARRFAGALEHAAARAQWRGETLGVSADGGALPLLAARLPDARAGSRVADDDVLARARCPSRSTPLPLAYAGQRVAADAIVPLRADGPQRAVRVRARRAGVARRRSPPIR